MTEPSKTTTVNASTRDAQSNEKKRLAAALKANLARRKAAGGRKK